MNQIEQRMQILETGLDRLATNQKAFQKKILLSVSEIQDRLNVSGDHE